MSNRITFIPTEFTNSISGTKSYGYRAYDDFHTCYDNNWEEPITDELEFLERIIDEVNNNQTPDGVKEMLEHCQEYELGLDIDNQSYQYEQISHLLDYID